MLGLALGVMLALTVRTVAYGKPVYWSLLWQEGPEQWLKFLAPITILLFLQAGLYASRERRAGPGRVVSSLVLVALVILAFGFGTGYDFTTTGLIPTAVVTCSLTIGILRWAYDSAALELMRIAGIRQACRARRAKASASDACSASSGPRGPGSSTTSSVP